MDKWQVPTQEVQSLIDQNFKIADLAKYFNVSKPTISLFLKENNLETAEMKKRRLAAEVPEREIADKYLAGSTLAQLGKEYYVSTSVIKRCLKNHKVKTRTNSESHAVYHCDIKYFDSIDTMNKAYLLGFICADGFVTGRNEVGIELNPKDREIVEFFKNELKTDKPIFENEQKVGLRIQNKQIANTLQQYYIVPNKSLTLNIQNVIQAANLNEDQIKAFMLGYFDGDGGIYHYIPSPEIKTEKHYCEQWSMNVTGTLETCLFYKNYFKVGFLTKRHNDSKNNYTYQIGGKNLVKKSLQQLYEIYDQLDQCLERKHNRFLELLEKS